jgi:hypothetical protein
MNTTRTYPRTLAAAFPDIRAGCIEYHAGHSLKAALSRLIRKLFN